MAWLVSVNPGYRVPGLKQAFGRSSRRTVDPRKSSRQSRHALGKAQRDFSPFLVGSSSALAPLRIALLGKVLMARSAPARRPARGASGLPLTLPLLLRYRRCSSAGFGLVVAVGCALVSVLGWSLVSVLGLSLVSSVVALECLRSVSLVSLRGMGESRWGVLLVSLCVGCWFRCEVLRWFRWGGDAALYLVHRTPRNQLRRDPVAGFND